jgi:hypothetical protein
MPDTPPETNADPELRSALAQELKDYALALPRRDNGNYASEEGYFFVPDQLPGYDFNREIVQPGTNEHFPHGALGVRVDENFWAVAAMPLRFAGLSIQVIVAILWPTLVSEAEYGPDV